MLEKSSGCDMRDSGCLREATETEDDAEEDAL